MHSHLKLIELAELLNLFAHGFYVDVEKASFPRYYFSYRFKICLRYHDYTLVWKTHHNSEWFGYASVLKVL